MLDHPDSVKRLHELRLADLREELDPTSDLRAMLERISDLAARARENNSDNALTPGFEAMWLLARELRLSLPPYMTSDAAARKARLEDIEERHGKALEAVRMHPLLAGSKALTGAARIGNRRLIARRLTEKQAQQAKDGSRKLPGPLDELNATAPATGTNR